MDITVKSDLALGSTSVNLALVYPTVLPLTIE